MAASVFYRDNNGEFIKNGLNNHIKKKYKPDTVFDKSFVPYLIMFLCAAIDITFFIDLFKWISYESVFIVAMEVAGMVFAFDVVPIYCGIQFRRVKQKISKDSFLLWLAIGVFVIASITNIILRVISMKVISGDASATSFFGTAVETNNDVSPETVALTIFASVVPFLTSIGSFLISYMCYSPLKIKKRNLEELLSEKSDEIRRVEAYIAEYDADLAFAEHLREDDYKKYLEMKNAHRAKIVTYCTYVRQRLQEHLADPTAINALSEENCAAILERLDTVLNAFEQSEDPLTTVDSDSTDETQHKPEIIAA